MILPITPHLLYVIPILVLSWFLGMVGRDCKYGFWGNFLISLIFTPLIGLIVVLAQDSRPDVKQK